MYLSIKTGIICTSTTTSALTDKILQSTVKHFKNVLKAQALNCLTPTLITPKYSSLISNLNSLSMRLINTL